MSHDSFEKVDSYFTTHKAPTALFLNKVDSDLLYLTKICRLAKVLLSPNVIPYCYLNMTVGRNRVATSYLTENAGCKKLNNAVSVNSLKMLNIGVSIMIDVSRGRTI